MIGFLSKYWKKIGLAVLGLFLTVSPLFLMFYIGLLAGHFITARFNWKLDIRVKTPKYKGKIPKAVEEEDLEELQHKDLIPEPKTTAVATKVFEHVEEKKEEKA